VGLGCWVGGLLGLGYRVKRLKVGRGAICKSCFKTRVLTLDSHEKLTLSMRVVSFGKREQAK
jgi:hypothetical protein